MSASRAAALVVLAISNVPSGFSVSCWTVLMLLCVDCAFCKAAVRSRREVLVWSHALRTESATI